MENHRGSNPPSRTRAVLTLIRSSTEKLQRELHEDIGKHEARKLVSSAVSTLKLATNEIEYLEETLRRVAGMVEQARR